ncbi:MAG TPA: PfkB family carbohydrate kinase [Gaiellaceae bacterium]|nr:PfkB family carbohydrate kinase [Gaiellaceae bacterium]
MIRFVAVGDLMVDVSAAGNGHAARIATMAGGSALNAATWAAGLGAEATVVGRVGDDPGGRLLLAELARRGVRTEVSIDPEAATGTVLVVDGEIRADRGANARFGPEHLPELEADAVLVSGHLPAATVAAALAGPSSPWIALDAARLSSIPPQASVVLANEEAARRLTGEPAEAAARVLARGRRLACVTLGARGAVAVGAGQVERATPETSAAEDGFGAGDAFAAGLLVALARGDELGDALAAACRCGALAAAGHMPSSDLVR